MQGYGMSSYFPRKEIIPGLWIGSQGDSENKNFIANKFVVNCSKDIPLQTNYGYRVPVWDDPEEHTTMIKHLPVVVRAIDEVLERGKSVLVHCRAGMQRSAAVVAGYLMYKKGMTWDEAQKFIQSKKPETFYPKATFAKTMRVYQALLGRCKG